MATCVNTRRWRRHQVDLPLHIVVHSGASGNVVPGRGTEISESGMALYAGVNLESGELMEVEFQAPLHTRVTGVIRNRTGYCFGLEFLTPLPC